MHVYSVYRCFSRKTKKSERGGGGVDKNRLPVTNIQKELLPNDEGNTVCGGI